MRTVRSFCTGNIDVNSNILPNQDICINSNIQIFFLINSCVENSLTIFVQTQSDWKLWYIYIFFVERFKYTTIIHKQNNLLPLNSAKDGDLLINRFLYYSLSKNWVNRVGLVIIPVTDLLVAKNNLNIGIRLTEKNISTNQDNSKPTWKSHN